MLTACSGGTVIGTTTAIDTTNHRVNQCDIRLTCADTGAYVVGDTGPAGGIVFYVDDVDAYKGWKYLEAAPNTWNGTSGDPTAMWGCTGISISTGTAIGTGATNMAAILDAYADLGIAARLAYELTVGTKSDWFQPSIDELHLMYTKMYTNKFRIGGFEVSSYWSSSESYAYFARRHDFYYGDQSAYDKGYTAYVRPVRAFGS